MLDSILNPLDLHALTFADGSRAARPRRQDRLPHHGPAAGTRDPRRLPLAGARRGRPAHGPGVRRRGHGGDGVLAGAARSGASSGSCSTAAATTSSSRDAVGGRRHGPGSAADRRGARDRPDRLRAGRSTPSPRLSRPAHRRRRGSRTSARCVILSSSRSPPAPTRCYRVVPQRARRPRRHDPRVERRGRSARTRPGSGSRAPGHRSTGSSPHPRTGPRPASIVAGPAELVEQIEAQVPARDRAAQPRRRRGLRARRPRAHLPRRVLGPRRARGRAASGPSRWSCSGKARELATCLGERVGRSCPATRPATCRPNSSPPARTPCTSSSTRCSRRSTPLPTSRRSPHLGARPPARR